MNIIIISGINKKKVIFLSLFKVVCIHYTLYSSRIILWIKDLYLIGVSHIKLIASGLLGWTFSFSQKNKK